MKIKLHKILLIWGLLFLHNSLFAVEDNIKPRGVVFPYFFAELLDVTTDSRYVYVSGVGGLMIVDARDQDNPKMIGRFDPGNIYTNRFYTTTIHNNLALCSARLAGLYFLDITTKTNPRLKKIFTIPNVSFEASAVIGDFALAAAHNNGLYVLDISDPRSPKLVGTFNRFNNVWYIKILDPSTAIIADGEAGIKILDISNLIDIKIISSVQTSGNARDLVVEDSFVYVAVGSSGFDIIDISEINKPFIISNYVTTGVTNHLDVAGDFVFTTTWKNVEVVDVMDKTYPKLVATEKTPVRAMGLAVSGDSLIYVADWAQFEIFQFSNIKNPDIDVIPSEIRFSSNQPVDLTIRNVGLEELTISEISIPSEDFFISNPPQTIAPGQEAIIQIQYTGSFAKPDVLRLKIVSNDPDEGETLPLVIVNNNRIGIGSTTFDFSLKDITGQTHSLSDYRGNVVVLVFFASW